MDARVADFITKHAQNLIGLDVALFFQANPQTFDTAEGLARRTHRDVEQVRLALERLAECGILDVFSRSEGRYKCFALARAPSAWDLLCSLSEAYVDDLDSRKQIVRLLMRKRRDPATPDQQHADSPDGAT